MFMKRGLYERYVPDTLLYAGDEGQLHRGHDSILRRDILLYIFPLATAQPEKLMHGSSVLQVLDRGETEKEGFVVLEYVPGLLLDQASRTNRLSLKEALGMARQFVQILQEASRMKGRGLLLTKHNLWLTEAGEVKVVNSWDVREERVGREISDIFRLMHHLMFGEVDIELPITQMIEEMALAYPGDPFIIRKSLRAIWRREEKKGVEQYDRMLAQTLEDITSLYHYIKKNQGGIRPSAIETAPEASDGEEAAYIPRSTRTRGKSVRNVKQKSGARFNLPAKRVAVIALVAIVCITAFSFMQNDKPSSAKSVDAVSPQTQNESVQEENNRGVEVPDVEGLTLAEAGQQLNQAGLRYKYYLESSLHKKGTVLKQNPAAGEKMSRVEVVELWVSE